MVSYTYEDLRDALDAIIRGNATDEAYVVASRFGYYELFFGAIYRKENWMEIKTAREILTRAKKDEIFDGEVPDTDAEVLVKAQEIVELAEQAWTSHVRGPEVEAILKLAASEQNGDAPKDSEDGDSDSGDAHAPPEGTSVGAFEDLPEKLSKSEPWDGYGEGTVKDVSEGINWFAENNPDDILDILKNVWAYESSHKNRSRILAFTIEAYGRFGGEVGQEEVESGAEVDQSDGGEVFEGSEGVSGEEGIEAEPSEDVGSESDAGDDSEPKAGAEGGEEGAGEAESTPKDQEGGSGKGISAETKLVNLVEKELARERVDGIPGPPQDKAPELPWNWADVSDTTLHDLMMQYASLAYYKSYQYARDQRIAMHCKEAADELRNKLLINAPKYDEKNKEIKVTVLEAQIASDPNVRRWRRVQSKYERYAAQAKHELDSLHKIVEALSRLETMRHQSWERARR